MEGRKSHSGLPPDRKDRFEDRVSWESNRQLPATACCGEEDWFDFFPVITFIIMTLFFINLIDFQILLREDK